MYRYAQYRRPTTRPFPDRPRQWLLVLPDNTLEFYTSGVAARAKWEAIFGAALYEVRLHLVSLAVRTTPVTGEPFDTTDEETAAPALAGTYLFSDDDDSDADLKY